MMDESFCKLPIWSEERAAICARLRENKSPIKIVLKTRDDTFFLQRWLAHHSAIVGMENLIVFDNGSEDPDVLSIYASLKGQLEVVRFNDFHNNLHRVEMYPELYEALRASCSYYSFLDTDEFLAWVNEDLTVISGPAVADKILASMARILPGIWLENVAGYDNRLWVNDTMNHLESGLKSGKPMISASLNVHGMINHNRQLPATLFEGRIPTNLIVAHLKRLSSRQRIQANHRKLIAYRALKKEDPVEHVLSMDAETLPQGNKRAWVKEIQRLWFEDEPVATADQPLRFGMIEFIPDQKIRFADIEQEKLFGNFIRFPNAYVRDALTEERSD